MDFGRYAAIRRYQRVAAKTIPQTTALQRQCTRLYDGFACHIADTRDDMKQLPCALRYHIFEPPILGIAAHAAGDTAI